MAKPIQGTLYLLHFSPPYKHARHYLGWTGGRASDRLATHLSGQGSPLVRAAIAAGCSVLVDWVRPGTRTDERRLKQTRNVPRRCALCKWIRSDRIP